MKIVSLVWFKIFPAKFGGQKGIAIFLEYLTAYFDITCLCSRDNNYLGNSLKVVPKLPVRKWQFINPIIWVSILLRIKKENAEVLIIEHPYHAITGILAKKLLKVRLVLHQHNLEHVRFREMGYSWWPILKFLESQLSRHADLVLFKTFQDQLKAIELFHLNPGKTFIVPYGIEKRTFNKEARSKISTKYNLSDNCKIFLFAGTLDYKPNAEAIENIYKKLFPYLDNSGIDYSIIICGRNKIKGFDYLQKLTAKHIINAGEVDNIDEYFFAADVFINPVTIGGGIQTKILDALSYQLPVICFDVMLSGIPSQFIGTLIHPANNGDWKKFSCEMLRVKKSHCESFCVDLLSGQSWERITKNVAEKIKLLA
jgi:glycosyltransferase involved in cell wall biosynthesis